MGDLQDCSWVARGWVRSLFFVLFSYASRAVLKTDWKWREDSEEDVICGQFFVLWSVAQLKVCHVEDWLVYTSQVSAQHVRQGARVIYLQIGRGLSDPFSTLPPSKSMFLSSRKKKLSPSTATPANGLTVQSAHWQQPPPQLGQPPFAAQSQSQPPQPHERSSPVCTWIAHAPPSGPLPSPFPRYCHALSATATAAGELFIFGGYAHGSPSNELYVFSTRNFSSTLWHTTGSAPSPRAGHSAVLTESSLLIWGGLTNFRNQKALTRNQRHDDSIHFLNLGMLEPLMSTPSPTDQSFLHSSVTALDQRCG